MRWCGVSLQCVLLICLASVITPKVVPKKALKKGETTEDSKVIPKKVLTKKPPQPVVVDEPVPEVDAADVEPEFNNPDEEEGAAREGRCTGCRNQRQADDLFDHIASTIKYSERLSYLALDMDWLERLLADDARVHVAFHDFSKVNLESATTLSDDLQHKSLSFFHDKAEYKDLNPKYYDHDGCKLGTQCQTGKNETDTAEKKKDEKDGEGGGEGGVEAAARRHYYIKRGRQRRRRRLEGKPIISGSKDDSAKTKEEDRESSNAASASTKDSTKTSPGKAVVPKILSLYDEEFQVLAFGFDKWKDITPREYEVRLDHFLAVNPCWIPLYEPSLPFTDLSYQDGEDGSDPNELNTHSILLLARLPSHSFYATCKLYKSIVARQFPPVCFFKQNRMR